MQKNCWHTTSKGEQTFATIIMCGKRTGQFSPVLASNDSSKP